MAHIEMRKGKVMASFKGSFPFEWSWDDTLAIGKGLGLALAGTAVAYLGTVTTDMTTVQGLITAAIVSTAVNALRKYVTNTTSS